MLADDPPRVDAARDPSQNGEQNVDEEVSAASTLEHHGDRRKEDGEEVEEDVTVGARRFGGHFWRCSG